MRALYILLAINSLFSLMLCANETPPKVGENQFRKVLAVISTPTPSGKEEFLYATAYQGERSSSILIVWKRWDRKSEKGAVVITNEELAKLAEQMVKTNQTVSEYKRGSFSSDDGRKHAVLAERSGDVITHLILRLQMNDSVPPVTTRFEIPKGAISSIVANPDAPDFLSQYIECQKSVALPLGINITGNWGNRNKISYFIMDTEALIDPRRTEEFFITLLGQAFNFTSPKKSPAAQPRYWKLVFPGRNEIRFAQYHTYESTPDLVSVALIDSPVRGNAYSPLEGKAVPMAALQSVIREGVVREMRKLPELYKGTDQALQLAKKDNEMGRVMELIQSENSRSISEQIKKLEKCRTVDDSAFRTELDKTISTFRLLPH